MTQAKLDFSELPGILPQGVEISTVGAIFADDTPTDVVRDVMKKAASLSRSTLFVLADAINHEIRQGRENFTGWAELTCIDPRELQNIGRVGYKIPHNERHEQQDFWTHKAVANLGTAERGYWLDEADEKKLTRRELRKSLSAGSLQQGDSPVDSGEDNVTPHVGKITAHVDKLEDDGTLDEADAEQIYALHRDLLPILVRHARLVKRLVKMGDASTLRRLRGDMANIGRS